MWIILPVPSPCLFCIFQAMRDLQLNHLRLLLLMASIASAMLLPAWALYDLRRIVLVLESVSVFFYFFMTFAFRNHSLLYSLNAAALLSPILRTLCKLLLRRGLRERGTCSVPDQLLVFMPIPFTTSSDLPAGYFVELQDNTSNNQPKISCLQLALYTCNCINSPLQP